MPLKVRSSKGELLGSFPRRRIQGLVNKTVLDNLVGHGNRSHGDRLPHRVFVPVQKPRLVSSIMELYQLNTNDTN